MDALRQIIIDRNAGNIHAGIPSYCTANEIVIEAIIKQAKRYDIPVLIEATANQVNQFGGYTGMKPADFRDFVFSIADANNFPRDRIILGGDHLGPLTWQSETEESAMQKSVELVKLFVLAGFKKIHLDTSMRVADDDVNKPLSDETIARRGAVLYKACEEAYQELKKSNPDELRPAFIVGSEVPIPGGAQEAENSVDVTKPEAVEKTIAAYKEQFSKIGIDNAFEDIIGIVVQPGVEFGDEDIIQYNRENAKTLTEKMKSYAGVVLEGHSTDYQSPIKLRQMVEDGIAILKVGPALTFAMREGLYALSIMEKELVDEADRANFIETLERIMLDNPGNWKKHYHGTEEELKLKRSYSFSDRARYYMANEEIQCTITKLFENMKKVHIPLGMLAQYMPNQYVKVRDGVLSMDPKELVEDCVVHMVEDYNFATIQNYQIGDAFIY